MLRNYELESIKNEITRFSAKPLAVKILSFITFVFLIGALTIITNTPTADSYEISIYKIFPWYFWFFIIATIFCGIICIIVSALLLEKNNNQWVAGFLAIIITNATLLFMPFIRGYTTYGRGDVLTHIGSIKYIIRTAHIEADVFYPIDHILTAIFSYIVNIETEHSVNVIPPIFIFLYIFSVSMLAKYTFESKKEILFLLGFTTIPIFSKHTLVFAPNVQTFFSLPFILYLYYRSRKLQNSVQFSILLFISLFFIVFSHPIDVLFLIFIFFILGLITSLNNMLNSEKIGGWSDFRNTNTLNIIIVCLVSFVTWYFSFPNIKNTFGNVYRWLIFDIGRPESSMHSEVLARANPDLLDIIKVIFNMYGQIIILGLLSLIFALYLFKIWKKNSIEQKIKLYHVFFLICFLCFTAVSVIVFFNDFIIDFGRVSKYILFFSSIFVALSFYLLFIHSEHSFSANFFLSIFLCIVLLLVIYFSVFNIYFSPIIKTTNEQVTEAEVSGMTLFFDNRNESLFIQEIGISQKRFSDFIFGQSTSRKNLRYGIDAYPIDHFGYENKTSLGESYEDNRYLLLSSLGRIMYPELYPNYEKYWRFTPQDFQELEKDKSVLKIHTNGNIDIYFIVTDNHIK